MTSSNLKSPYCRQRSSVSVLDVVEPRAAGVTRGPRPGGWWLLALMTIHHELKGCIRRHTWVQADNVTEQGLATIKQDVTNEWKTWSLKHVCVRDMLPPLNVKYLSLAFHMERIQCLHICRQKCPCFCAALPGLDKGESWCWFWGSCISTLFAWRPSQSRQVQFSVTCLGGSNPSNTVCYQDT